MGSPLDTSLYIYIPAPQSSFAVPFNSFPINILFARNRSQSNGYGFLFYIPKLTALLT